MFKSLIDEFHKQYKNTIIQTFRRLGLTVNPDGSEDAELKIKGLDGIKVGDWQRKDIDTEEDESFGGLTAPDIRLVEAAQVKLNERVEKNKAKHQRKLDEKMRKPLEKRLDGLEMLETLMSTTCQMPLRARN